MWKLIFVAAVFVVAYAEDKREATATLSVGELKGTIHFTTQPDGKTVLITGKIENVKPPGKHGFHIHESGDLKGDCLNAKGHFNPDKKHHGAPEDEERHVGDLGNIIADENGIAEINITDKLITLDGKNSIIGRAVVVHSGEDDLGKGNETDSRTTGHAGSRLGCGVIV